MGTNYVAAPGVVTSLAFANTQDGGTLMALSTDRLYRQSSSDPSRIAPYRCAPGGPRAGDITDGTILREVIYTPPASVTPGDTTDQFEVSVQKVFIQNRAEARQPNQAGPTGGLGQAVNCYADGAAERQTITLTRPIAPTITAGNEAIMHAENTPATTPVATYTTDDTNSIAWSHAGTDADLFLIDPTSGVLTFKASPNYEIPTDAGGDRVYDITITATETNGVPINLASEPLVVTVTIINVDEPGVIGAITGDAQVGQTLTAGTVESDPDAVTATNMDGDVSVTPASHTWQSAVEGADATAAVDDAAWTDTGTTTPTYMPVVGDVGRIIRVVATYPDVPGFTRQTAASAATGAVAAATVTLSTDATLSALDVSAGTLNPTFESGIYAYAVSVENGVQIFRVTPTVTATGKATVTVGGLAVASGQPSGAIGLNVGNNLISIAVTAEDPTVATQTYAVTVTRAAPTPSIALAADTGAAIDDGITTNGQVDVTLAAGATAWAYTIKDGTPTAVSDTSVTFFTLPEGVYEVSEVQVVQTLNSVDSAPAMFAMQITVDITAPVIALAGGPVTVAHGGTYAEADDAGISGAGSDDTTATTTTRPDSMIVEGVAVDTNTAGDYTITYIATDLAGNVSNSVTRTVTVSPALSADATLSGLTIAEGGNDVALMPNFNAATDTYTADVGTDVASITVTPTVTDTTGAAVTVGGTTVASGQPSGVIGLSPGNNTITIIVTAANGSTIQTYTVTVARAVPAPGIALRRDTGINDIDNGDRITRNRDIEVTDLASGATWEFSSNSGTGYDTGSGTSFSLSTGVYETDQVRVRQTVNGVVSDHAGLEAFTFDAVKPTATLGSIVDAVLDQAGQMHVITFSEDVTGLAVDDFVTSSDVTVTAVTAVSGSGATYTITYTPTMPTFILRLKVGSVSDVAGNSAAAANASGTATAANTAPTIDSGNEAPSYAENTPVTTPVATYTATDADNSTIAWSVGGTDASFFDIDPTNGALTFKASPNYEIPTDDGGNRVYDITITATETETNGTPTSLASEPLMVTVTVADAEDAGSVSAISGTAQVGQTLTTGTVTDEDGVMIILGHQWQRGNAAGDNANNIVGETGNTYEVVVADEGSTLRVLVSYMDGFGGNTDQVTSASTEVVTPAPADTTAPTVATFDDPAAGVIGTEQTHTITFSEAVTGLEVGDFDASTDVTVNSVTPDSGAHTTYTIAFTPTATAFSLTLAINSVSDTADTPNLGPASAASATGAANEAASTDAALSGLTISQGSLLPAFSTDNLPYTATVPNNVASVMVTPTTNDGGATVTVNGDAVDSGEASEAITLAPGVAIDITIEVTAEDASTQAYTVAVTRTANTAPRITAGSAALNYQENESSTVEDYDATDDEGNTITWSVGGTDANLFTIDAAGELGFNTPPNFEVPTDAGGNHVYDLTVTATDNGTPNEEHTLDVVVTVTNVEETGIIGPISGTAQVGVALTAGAVTDPDAVTPTNLAGTVADITYQWQSVDGATTTGIGTDMTYMPGVGDEGKTIQVIATYTDGFDSGNTVTSNPTAAVQAAAPTAALALPNVPLLRFTVNTATSLVLPEATGGTAPLTYMLVALAAGASLPPGLDFDANTRTLSGTPTVNGRTNLSYTVTDANAISIERRFGVSVQTGLTLNPPSDQFYTVGTAISLVLSAAGGTSGGELTYTLTGPRRTDPLPTGLTFAAASRTLSGTPSEVTSETSLTYHVSEAGGAPPLRHSNSPWWPRQPTPRRRRWRPLTTPPQV